MDFDISKYTNLIDDVASQEINRLEATKHKYSHQKLIVVIGPMGSGKTTFIREREDISINSVDGLFYYNSIDKWVPVFRHLNLTSYETYLLCREVGKRVTDWTQQNNISMIIEGTGINWDTIDYIELLMHQGYQLKIYFLKTPLQVCRCRIKNRNDMSEHKVSDDDVIRYHKELWGDDTQGTDIFKRYCQLTNNIEIIENYEINEVCDL